MRARSLALLLPPLLACCCGRGGAADDGGNDAPFVVAGYLPDYRAYIDVGAAATHLTDLMAFSLTPEAVLSSSSGGCCLGSEHYAQIRRARDEAREARGAGGPRLLVTVGGGGRSQGFREAVTGNAEVRRRFIDSLVQLW